MHIEINGRRVETDPPGHTTLLDLLRDEIGLLGTKRVCDRGECGACTVLLDGEVIYSCIALVHGCDGRRVSTIEGLGAPGAPHALQEAFVAEDAAQCGFCTPGQLMAAAALLARDPDPGDDAVRAALAGNLCRCGTYPKILRAVKRAAASLRATGAAHA